MFQSIQENECPILKNVKKPGLDQGIYEHFGISRPSRFQGNVESIETTQNSIRPGNSRTYPEIEQVIRGVCTEDGTESLPFPVPFERY